MKRILKRLTFILIGAALAISGDLLNLADVSNSEVASFDEILCRKIVILDDYWRRGSVVLEVTGDTPVITLKGRSPLTSYYLYTTEGVIMNLQYRDPDTDTKISEIRLVVDKDNARIISY